VKDINQFAMIYIQIIPFGDSSHSCWHG